MRLQIIHETTYSYEVPILGMVQSLRLTPSVFEGQRIASWTIEVTQGRRGGTFRDGAGDWVEGWSVRGPISEVVVAIRGQVETRDTAGVLRGHRESVNPLVYLRDTAVTAPDDQIRALSASVAGEDGLDMAHRLSAAVAEAMRYRPGVTQSTTTGAEALALGEGVCQDHAHVLIAAARLCGLPARYVSGYLHSNLDGVPHDAAHAWAEIHTGPLGWVGFDAANRCCPDDRYVRLGSGFDAIDAAPISGTTVGNGGESLDVRVAVEEMEQ